MQSVAQAIVMFSVLVPTKGWFAPDQPLNIQIRGAGGGEVTLVLIDFVGKILDPQGPVNVKDGQTVDLKVPWPQIERNPGTYVLLAVPEGKSAREFVGTPLVIGVRGDRRLGAPPGPMIVRVDPLRYVVMSTDKGDVSIVLYYQAAPNTVANFLRLCETGFYDGLSFHRVIPNMLVQAGDPRGDGTGGPGYRLEAEFNTREHLPGVISMARQTDPLERQGDLPRSEYANSAGSQFFVCLDRERNRQFNGRYTAFAEVESGMDVITEIAKLPTNPETDRPTEPVLIKSMRVIAVTSSNNPYETIMDLSPLPASATPTTAPAGTVEPAPVP